MCSPPLTNVFSSTPAIGGHSLLLLKSSLRLLLLMCSLLHNSGYASQRRVMSFLCVCVCVNVCIYVCVYIL